VPAPATLTGTVITPRQQPVASARVLALSVDADWVDDLARDGQRCEPCLLATLRAGNYLLQAAPDVDPALPGLSGEIAVTRVCRAALTIVCPDKSQGTGRGHASGRGSSSGRLSDRSNALSGTGSWPVPGARDGHDASGAVHHRGDTPALPAGRSCAATRGCHARSSRRT